MIRNLMATAAVTGLLIGSAAAEGISAPPGSGAPPSAGAPAAKPEASAPANQGTNAGGKIVNAQRADQYLASQFKGTNVLGPDNQKVGDVKDILFDKQGKVLAYVVSVGGFLGIGAKDVALEPSAFQVVAGDKSKNESDKLKISMNKDQLQQAANFEPYKAPTTTGMGGGTSSRPSVAR